MNTHTEKGKNTTVHVHNSAPGNKEIQPAHCFWGVKKTVFSKKNLMVKSFCHSGSEIRTQRVSMSLYEAFNCCM